MKRENTWWIHLVLLIAVVIALYPVLWVLSLAISAEGLGTEARILPIPSAPSLDNFRAVIGADAAARAVFARQVLNSLLISLGTAAVAIVLATPAGYVLARYRFKGSSAGVKALLFTQMFPTVASAVPLYLLLSALGLLDSRVGLVLVYAATAVPFAVFQIRGAFEAIPVDLEEAARVDGATRTQAFLKVALPAARPALAITFLFAFMAAWNEFVLAATLLSREDAFTLPVVLQRLVGEHDARWGVFAAGALLVSVPVVAIFYAVQRQLVGGLTAGGVKG